MFLLLSLLVFILAVFLHIFIHRMLARWGIVTAKPVAVYAVGFLLLLAVSLSLTGIVLYCLLVGGYLLFFFSFYWEGQSPSVKLLTVLRKHGPLAYKQILPFFTNQELFGRRLKLLIAGGQIGERGGTYRALGKGKAISAFFGAYRRLLRWDLGGL